MGQSRRRLMVVLLALAAIVGACTVRVPGEPSCVEPLVQITVGDASVYEKPQLALSSSNGDAIYALTGLDARADAFRAVRISRNGQTSDTTIPLAQLQAGFSVFTQADVAGHATVRVEGLSYRTPRPYLFRLPGGGGPGLDWVPAQTGTVIVETSTRGAPRAVIQQRTFNADALGVMRDAVVADADGRYVATLLRDTPGWRLCVFDGPGHRAAQR